MQRIAKGVEREEPGCDDRKTRTQRAHDGEHLASPQGCWNLFDGLAELLDEVLVTVSSSRSLATSP